jgi:hypothetical protein
MGARSDGQFPVELFAAGGVSPSGFRGLDSGTEVNSVGPTAAPRLTCEKRTSGVTLLLALVVIGTRLPFLGHGYGGDPDGWRALIAAKNLLATGRYVPSRPPGNPLWMALGLVT